jgi:hypothetical protein
MTDPNAQRAVCCGPVCKRPATDCVAATYGAGIIERAKAAGFAVVRDHETVRKE